MKLLIHLSLVSILLAACSIGCSGEEPDMTKFENPDLGQPSEESVSKLAKVKDILKEAQKDVPIDMEFQTHKYKDYFSISFPKAWGNVHERDWLGNDTEYAATIRDPQSGAGFTLYFKPLQDEFMGKVDEHVLTWLEGTGGREGMVGKILKKEFKRDQIQHYLAAAYEFMADKNGTKYAGYAAGIIDYRDEFRLYGMVEMDKYPDFAKLFKKIASSFKLLNHYNKLPGRKWRKKRF